MEDLSFREMQQIQKELQAKYREKWEPVTPETGRNKLLWAMIEMGEVADIIKKQGDRAIMEDAAVREHFTEELCDVLMYLNDILLCYDIPVSELRRIYLEKHEKNMKRW